MVKPVRKSSNKNPPVFSHEFIIQNHADIVSCIAMLFVIGLLVQATTPIASIFIVLQHNVTEAGEIPLYTSGILDWAAVFFYSLICIVVHAIIQEYILDKASKKFHLSKSKLAIFNTSGQLAIYYLITSFWGIEILLFRERFLADVALIWSEYPAPMSFMLKLFLIVQIAYVLHEIPELYFTRVKRDEWIGRTVKHLAELVLIIVPYFLNFHRLLAVLLVLHQLALFVDHSALVLQTVDKDDKFTKLTRTISSIVMLAARFSSIIVAVLTLWFGLARAEQHELNISTGYYNTPTIRLVLLISILSLQIYLTAVHLSRQLKQAKEDQSTVIVGSKSKATSKKEKSKKNKKVEPDSDLPEVDQNLRSRIKSAK